MSEQKKDASCVDPGPISYKEFIHSINERKRQCMDACDNAGIEKPQEAIPRLVEAVEQLISRKEQGKYEDAHIFAEWDDLEDALAMVRNKT